MTLPAGFRLRVDRSTRRHDDGATLSGGMPARVLRLSAEGARVAARLLDGGVVTTPGEAALARRLLGAGLAHPLPSAVDVALDVVVPVYDDVRRLERCLAWLAPHVPVTVVDDASRDADAVAAVAATHGARLVRLDVNAGPAAARNAGTAATSAAIVAFVDADAVASGAVLRELSAHFADPRVVAAAPRIRALPMRGRHSRRRRMLAVTADDWSPLDLGPDPSLVGPGRRVAYVPSTVLLVRRSALDAAGGFDASLRYGEDVDLVWRLAHDGGQVRYDPGLFARHDEPQTWARWLTRRAAYGSSAAPLTARHPDAMVPATFRPAPLAAVVLAAAGQRRAAAAVTAATAASVAVKLHRAGAARTIGTTGALLAPPATALAAGRWLTQLWWPVVAAAAARRPRVRRSAVVLTVAPPLLEWVRRRPPIDPVRWTLAVWADEIAYGVGVWRGCLRQRTLRPLLPRLR